MTSLVSLLCFSLFLLFGCAHSNSGRQSSTYWIPIDGYSNNINNPSWGISGTPFFREGQPYYKNVTGMVPVSNINTRNISNWLFDDDLVSIPSSESISVLGMVWGQFLTHDIMLTNKSTQIRYIDVPPDDKYFSPEWKIPFPTTSAVLSSDGIPQIMNLQTAYVDGSTVYGFNDHRMTALRNGAFLRTHNNSGEFLPLNSVPDLETPIQMDNDARRVSEQQLFAAGDLRASENPILTSLHTIFMKEHNRRAAQFLDRGYSEEDAFQEARRWVVAHLQSIHFNEYYPVILGEPMDAYTKYDETLDPSVSLFFSSSSFRYGHSETPEMFSLLEENREPVSYQPTILTRDAYFYPTHVLNFGIEPFVRGAAAQVCLKVDLAYASAVRNFLFGNPGKGGVDLATFNLERNRDNGVPPYNQMRQYFGLQQFDSFDTFPAVSEDVRQRLKTVYGNDISQLDAYVGGLAEMITTPRSVVGPLFRASLKAEYHKLRNANRLYFENPSAGFNETEIEELKATKLSQIILRNTKIQSIQCSVFVATSLLDCSKNPISPIQDSATVTTLDGDYILSWTFPDDHHITFQMEAQTSGWVGMSFPDRAGYMLDADAVIGWVTPTGISVHDYFIDSVKAVQCPSGVCLDTARGGFDSITDVNATTRDGYTTIRYTRPLGASDSYDRAISVTSQVAINVAFGASDALGYHIKKGGLIVDLKTGAASEVAPDKSSINAHAILMFISWAFIFPIGILIVRFGKQIFPAWWFRGHMFLQFAGLIVVLLALMLAIHYIANKGSTHFSKPHTQLGLATILLSIITPALGQITAVTWKGEREEIPFFPDKLHWILGYISIIMAYVNFGLGLHDYKSASVIWGLCYAWVGFSIVGYIAFYIYNSRQLVSFGSDSDKSDKL